MLQVTQNYRTGSVEVVDVPPPALRPGGVIVRLACSLISTGTERGKVELARKSLVEKARERPDAVRQVLETVRREGIAATYRRVLHRLDRMTPIGYSAAGVVTEVGPGVTSLRAGDRVAVGGGGYASHAELVWVPQNLAARIPDGVSFEAASFSAVAAVPLHGLRLARIALGETVAVIGLGLLGQLAVRLARAAGCRVVGCDLLEARIRMAQVAGMQATDPDRFVDLVQQLTGGLGADTVLLTAAAASSEPLRLAAAAARARATVVAVGAVGLEVPREMFYRKELSLIVSRSYGPGRYDPAYEEKGTDYPVAYVRWTEGRNLAAVLSTLADGTLDVGPLISRRYPVAEATRAYEALLEDDPSLLGLVLEYPPAKLEPSRRASRPAAAPTVSRSPLDVVGLGFIGAGSFASNVLVPALRATGAVRLVAVASASGLSAQDAVRRLKFERAVRGAEEIIADPAVNAVIIATPHHVHAEVAVAALEAGKAVFVEKPLAIAWEQLEAVRAVARPGSPLMVGFNRRFSPHVGRIVELAQRRVGAMMVVIRVNAGAIARESSLHDPDVGGGRLVGEGCHFVDLACCLVGAPPSAVRCVGVGAADAKAPLQDDFVVTLEFPDGSVASIVYTTRGDAAAGKERVEVLCDGWTVVVDDFDRSIVTRGGRRTVHRARGAKGHREEVAAFVAALRSGGPMPIPLDDLLASSAATLAARDSLGQGGSPVRLAP